MWYPFGTPSTGEPVAISSAAALTESLAPLAADHGGSCEEAATVAVDVHAAQQPGDSLTIELFCPQCGQRLGIPLARFLDDFSCPRCGTVEQAARLVPHNERIIPAPAVERREPPGVSAMAEAAAPDTTAPANAVSDVLPSPASAASPSPTRSAWSRSLSALGRFDDATRGHFARVVFVVALVAAFGRTTPWPALASAAWPITLILVVVLHLGILLSRLRDDAGMITWASTRAGVAPSVVGALAEFRACFESDATAREASWGIVRPICYSAVFVAAGAATVELFGAETDRLRVTAGVVAAGSCGVAVILFALRRRRDRAQPEVAATGEARPSIAVSGCAELGARVFDLRLPHRVEALRRQLGADLLRHVVDGLSTWRPRVARQARELEIQHALRRHLRRHLERVLGPAGGSLVRDHVISIKDERTDRDGRADVQVENIMIEVKKSIRTRRDCELAIDQAAFYVRGWTQRSSTAAARGPVILVVTQAEQTFENEFAAVLSQSARTDAPLLVLAAGFR